MKLRSLMALAVGALLLVGCVGRDPPKKERYVFRLDRSGAPSAAQVHAAKPNGVLKVHRIRVSPLYDRKNFVFRTSDTTYQEDFYREFYALPGVLIRLATIDWFEESPLFERVLTDTGSTGANWLIEGEANRLFIDLRGPEGPRVDLQITLSLIDADDPRLRSALEGTYEEHCRLADSSSEAMAVAWSSCLASVLSQFEIAASGALKAR